jgi:hypothetical protein
MANPSRYLQPSFIRWSLIATATLPQLVWALPDPRQKGRIGALQSRVAADPALRGAELIPDDQNPATVYVTPIDKKSSGRMARVGGAVDCGVLRDMYDLTYAVPSDFQRAAKEGIYSPFFDYHFGIPYRNADLLERIIKVGAQQQNLIDAHAREYGEYLATRKDFEAAVNELQQARDEIKAIDDHVREVSEDLRHAANAEESARMRESLQAAQAQQAARRPEAVLRREAALKREGEARQAYHQAYAAWVPYEYDFDRQTKERAALESGYTVLSEVMRKAFEASQKTLLAYETKIVGRVSIGYNLWDDEVNRAQAAIGPGYGVTKIPLRNVRAASAYALAKTTTADASGVGRQQSLTVQQADADSPLVSGQAATSTSGPFTNAQRDPLQVVAYTPEGGAGTFEAFVTQGAYCTGSSNRQRKTFSGMGANDHNVSFEGYAYRESDVASPIFAQNVALNYEYLVAAEPMSVSCTLNVESFANFVSSSGKSGFLFWRKKWEESELTVAKDNGLECTIHNPPTGQDAVAQQAYLRDLRQSMTQQMVEEFILNYAKSWNTTTESASGPAIPAPVAQGMPILCGTNPYCQVTSVVLKSASELFGAPSTTGRRTEKLSGTLHRDYTEFTYRVQPGSTTIELSVQR